MGAVYLAEHDRIGRRDAIKVLNRDLADDDSARARFHREARNASYINHPHVCTVYDFGETEEGLPFIAMEYVEGETLTDLLEREGPLPPSRAAELTAQVTRALEAAHARDIVHRDLKPDNVMLTRDAKGAEVAKVVDFGIAKAMVGEEDGRQDITRQGLVVGTPQYVSPEQVEGKDLDGRSDLYSLGIVLFRMLTGRIPFSGETWQEVMTKRLSEPPMSLAEATSGEGFPAELQDVVSRALRRDPGERYQDAADFRAELLAAVRSPAGGGAGRDAAPPEPAPAASREPESRTERVGQGSAGGPVPATEVGAEPVSVSDAGGGPPSVPWRSVAVAVAAVASIAGLSYLGFRAVASGGSASDTGEPPSAERVAEASGGEATGDPAGGEGGSGQALAAGGGEEPAAGAAGADTALRSEGSDGGGGSGPGGDTDVTGPSGGGAAENAPEAIAAADAEAVLMRQFTAVGQPGLAPSRLRAIAGTARALWSRRSLADDQRALAAHVVGLVHLGRGDTVESCPWLQRAVRLDPDGRGYRSRLDAVRPCRP